MSRAIPQRWFATTTRRGIPVVRSRTGESVCTLDWRNIPQSLANAKMLAAAPDMFNALIEAVEMLDSLNSAYGSEKIDEVSRTCRRAMVKAARGEA